MKTGFAWLAGLLLCAPALAGDLFEHPKTSAQAQALLSATMPGLGQVELVRGRFSQRRFLREIPTPLVSTGEFLLVRDRGIWWHTLTPEESERTLIPGGESRRQLAASTLFALFALDLDTLARSFDLFGMRTKSDWQLGLRPHDAALAAWFSEARIRGGKRVQQVTLVEASGDRTQIDLKARPQPLSSLTSGERQRFEN